jgi:hypothetical protein
MPPTVTDTRPRSAATNTPVGFALSPWLPVATTTPPAASPATTSVPIAVARVGAITRGKVVREV